MHGPFVHYLWLDGCQGGTLHQPPHTSCACAAKTMAKRRLAAEDALPGYRCERLEGWAQNL